MNALARNIIAASLLVSTAGCMAPMAPTPFLSVQDATHAERGRQVQFVKTFENSKGFGY
jgi:hypothetical protein